MHRQLGSTSISPMLNGVGPVLLQRAQVPMLTSASGSMPFPALGSGPQQSSMPTPASRLSDMGTVLQQQQNYQLMLCQKQGGQQQHVLNSRPLFQPPIMVNSPLHPGTTLGQPQFSEGQLNSFSCMAHVQQDGNLLPSNDNQVLQQALNSTSQALPQHLSQRASYIMMQPDPSMTVHQSGSFPQGTSFNNKFVHPTNYTTALRHTEGLLHSQQRGVGQISNGMMSTLAPINVQMSQLMGEPQIWNPMSLQDTAPVQQVRYFFTIFHQ